MKTEISVLITTFNRPQNLKDCLQSVLSSNFENFEILVLDQSENGSANKIVGLINDNRIRFFKSVKKGKSKGLNFLINKARGKILAFTDDDCIVKKNWLRTIHLSYKNNSDIVAVFGNTLPYRSANYPGKLCAATFIKRKTEIHLIQNNEDIYRRMVKGIGIGNNMSILKSVLNKIGTFREWLGPGSIGQNGEETEVIFRILSRRYAIQTNPKMVVYHNRWLSYKQERVLQAKYTRGYTAFASYYLFSIYSKQVGKLIKNRLIIRLTPFARISFKSFKSIIVECFLLIFEFLYFIIGLIIGLSMIINLKLSLSGEKEVGFNS